MDKCPKCGKAGLRGLSYPCGSRPRLKSSGVTESVKCLRRQLAAANERAGRLEKELAERSKDIVFFSDLRDSAVESLAKLEAALIEWEGDWFAGGEVKIAADNKLREVLIEMGIIDRILGGA